MKVDKLSLKQMFNFMYKFKASDMSMYQCKPAYTQGHHDESFPVAIMLQASVGTVQEWYCSDMNVANEGLSSWGHNQGQWSQPLCGMHYSHTSMQVTVANNMPSMPVSINNLLDNRHPLEIALMTSAGFVWQCSSCAVLICMQADWSGTMQRAGEQHLAVGAYVLAIKLCLWSTRRCIQRTLPQLVAGW
jgi:hypothetical protein